MNIVRRRSVLCGLLALSALGCVGGAPPEAASTACAPSIYVADPRWDGPQVCGPGTHIRTEAIGDGRGRRTAFICDCPPIAPTRSAP